MSEPRTMDLAVIGMACRFPGADTLDAFWHNIRNGIESITGFSEEELLVAGVDPDLLKNPSYVRAGAPLSNVEGFDAAFFGFSPREAAILDPQHRLFLECAWEAFEHAGYAVPAYDGYVSVHAGTGMNSYLIEHLYANRDAVAAVSDMFQVQMGNDKDHLATRVSYKLNLKGPSLSIQTACSTSLVAIHLACQSLLNGESDIALAGGVTVQLPQRAGYLHQEGMILSPDGHCRAFDADARGTVGGSGAGAVVLKRLSRALDDGDTVYAVVRGSAINNDGAVKIGYTAPSVTGQKEVISEALALADVDPATITLVEAHGTGTELGDPIEVAALTQAFRAETDRKRYCALGSVKTNVGHLDAAAGVCGFIKTVLALHHGILPPSLHFKQPNPKIDFANSPFYVNTTAAEWRTVGHPRRAGVSSFGIGGTNAHVILEEAPPQAAGGPSRQDQLLVLSAKTSTALELATEQLVRHLEQQPDADLADVAYTLQHGRYAMPYRRMIVGQRTADVIARWTAQDEARPISYVAQTSAPTIAFMFPGQGAQHVEMARELYDAEPVFREQVDQCAEIIRSQSGLDLRTLLYPEPAQLAQARERINDTAIAQPALFTIEYALAKLWASWGVRPASMIGHSVGEYVAACLAGVFSLEDALQIITMRGQLMQQLPAGAMLAVSLPEQAVRALLSQDLSLAAVNGPGHCVVAGPHEPIAALAEQLEHQQVTTRRLRTSHAFHSTMMRPILEAFTRELAQIRLRPPRIPYLSNVTGDWISAAQATDPLYWADHLHQTVRFGDGLQHLLAEPNQILLEVGPSRTLGTILAHHPQKAPEQLVLASLGHPQHTRSAGTTILQTLGQLWLAGVAIDWAQFTAHERRQRLPLPTYPFERQRHWIDAQPAASHEQRASLQRLDIADWFSTPSWKRSILPRPESTGASAWLLFIDEHGLGRALADQLRAGGQAVVTVERGTQFEQLGQAHYAIHPSQSSDYDQLFQTIAAEHTLPQHIVHLWNISPTPAAMADSGVVDAGFASMLCLAQAIGSHRFMEPIELTSIVNGLSSVRGDELLCPEKALMLAACTVFTQEYPHKRSRCVDILWPAADASGAAQVQQQVLQELRAAPSDTLVAYRGRHRWVQTYEQVDLKPDATTTTRLRQGGVYLITGGLGGIGLALAQDLARRVQARLLLLSRSSLPPQEDWSDWRATHDDADSTSRKIVQLQQIMQLGSEIELITADVSDSARMQRVIPPLLARFGRIDGIIHAAGVAGGGIIQHKDAQVAAAEMAAKVAGTTILHQLVRESPPDFMVLCSSLRAITGGAGQVDYCAANAFLDAYAQSYQAATDTAVISINWDGWKEVGMSVEATRRLGLDPESLHLAITNQEGAQVFEWALSSGLPQIIVSTVSLQAQIDREARAATVDMLAPAVAPQRTQGAHPRPNLATPYCAPATANERMLATIWQEVFGIERIGTHDNFFELGGDSIISIQTITRAHKLGLQLTSVQIFEHQTIARLANIAASVASAAADQGPVSGMIPLTPIQHWFFKQEQRNIHHFNQAILLKITQAVDPQHVEQALGHLLLHHDALRLRFEREPDGWRQTHAASEASLPCATIDLSALPPEQQPAALEAEATILQASLDISSGPLMRAALVTYGPGQDQHLLVIAHHLVIDSFSWRILYTDVQAALEQITRGQPPRLPAKTTSFKQWAEQLVAYAHGEHIQSEIPYWRARASEPARALPRDHVDGLNLVGSIGQVCVSLTATETHALLQELPKAYHLQTQDVLVAVLAQTLSAWVGAPSVVIDIEAQGRDLALDGVDLLRTVGWFTALYPVALTLEHGDDPDRLLKSVKEQLRALPNNGLSYGALRYLRDDRALAEQLAAAPQAEVVFFHMGQLDGDPAATSTLTLTQGPVGHTRSLNATRPYLLEISSMITEGCLRLEWLYSQDVHHRSTIEQLGQAFLETLRACISRCQSSGAGGFTPSDFPLAALNEHKLNKLATLLNKGAKHKGR